MERRSFLTKAGVLAVGLAGCSTDKKVFGPSGGSVGISGVVKNADGDGVSGVVVSFRGGGRIYTARTDESGAYSAKLVSGDYTVVPEKQGYDFKPSSSKISVKNSNAFVFNVMAVLSVNSSGVIPKKELGKTGIMLSSFGFGSHVSEANRGSQREIMIREAYDRGVSVFDIYDVEGSHNQYAPMGQYLAPMINETVISISLDPPKGYTVEQEIDRVRGLINRDYVDMVRMHNWEPNRADFGLKWEMWEELFRLRDLGKIRAVGLPVHAAGEGVHTKGEPIINDLDSVLTAYPDDLNYVVFPFNFYHNIGWPLEIHPEGFIPMAQRLREKGIGIVTMKPFAGDAYISTLKQAATTINPDLSFNQAAIRYILNSGLEPDTTFTGMNLFSEFKENVAAYYKPEISQDESALLTDVAGVAGKVADKILPEHYKFLKGWAGKNTVASETV
jgi:predicted aldo/keto reductase-like oxidoreductase